MNASENIEITRPVDVLVEVGTGGMPRNHDGTDHSFHERIVLIPGVLEIGPINQALGKQILDACSPRGHNYSPHRQFGVRFALVRKLDADDDGDADTAWDRRDALIQQAVAVSRWIRPTPIGLACAVRVRPADADGELKIVPCSPTNVSAHAFVQRDLMNDRLTVQDARELQDLLPRLLATPLPERVGRVMWNCEYIFRTSFLNVAWHLVASSLEALVHTSRDHAKQQFSERVAELGRATGLTAMTETVAGAIYSDIRSALAHGGKVVELDKAPNLDHFVLAMDVIRKTLRKCVEDPAFARNFSDHDSIRTWRPVYCATKRAYL